MTDNVYLSDGDYVASSEEPYSDPVEAHKLIEPSRTHINKKSHIMIQDFPNHKEVFDPDNFILYYL